MTAGRRQAHAAAQTGNIECPLIHVDRPEDPAKSEAATASRGVSSARR